MLATYPPSFLMPTACPIFGMDDFLHKLAHSVGRNLRGAKRSFDRRIPGPGQDL